LEQGSEEKFALALAQGVLHKDANGEYQITTGREKEAEELGIVIDEKTKQYLKKFGEDLELLGVKLETQNQILENNAIAIAENTKALISFEPEKYGEGSDKYYDYMNAILTSEDYTRMVEEERTKLTKDFDDIEIIRLLEKQFGLGTTYDKETETVMSLTGEKIIEGVGQEYFKLLEANRLATERFVAAG
jgi:hypothetical protein